MIRKATHDDLRCIVEMAEKFYQFTSYWTLSKIPFSPNDVAVLATAMIDDSVVNVVDIDGEVIGMIGIILIPFIFNPQFIHAGEIVWWVEPGFNNEGWGRKLLRSIDQSCKDAGAVHIQMIDLPNSPVSAKTLLGQEGYHLTENAYTKVV